MEAANRMLFLYLNARPGHSAAAYALALFLGQYWNFVAVAGLGGWMAWRRDYAAGVRVVLTCALALLAAYAIGHFYPHPRPFAVGLGHAWIHHSASPSFPSHHLTFYWSITMALSFLALPHWKKWGLALTLFGWAQAWARVYLGVHYPLDMVGAWCVALTAAWVVANLLPLRLPENPRPLSVKRS